MGRISSYKLDTIVSGSETLLGSDFDGSTVNISLTDVVDFMHSQGVSGANIFKSTLTTTSFASGNIKTSGALNNVSSLLVSKNNIAGHSVVDVLNEFTIGKRIKLFGIPHTGQFQRYRITNSNSQTDRVEFTVSPLSGSHSSFLEESYYGLTLVEDDKNFNISFSNNESLWSGVGPYTLNITHNLDKNATIDVFNSNSQKVIGAIKNNTLNSIQVEFTSKFSGTAYIN
jgi:hypothetical protein